MTDLLLVYGTLAPGEERWHHLEPFVEREFGAVVVDGTLYDTGRGYPAAVFGTGDRLHGRVYGLRDLHLAWTALDEVESAVDGLYRRVVVATEFGVAHAYECGDQSLLAVRVASGRWSDVLRTD
jgi:gamma-glutamylcyclotransferase (GGCT)/AIG2-like uncharacterized protein YtfP